MNRIEKVKECSPWTEVLEVHTGLFNSAMNGGGRWDEEKKAECGHHRLKPFVSDVGMSPPK